MGERTSNVDQSQAAHTEGATHPANRDSDHDETNHQSEYILMHDHGVQGTYESRSPIDRQSIITTVGWVSRSETRVQILVLLTEGARDLMDLENALTVHRTTLRRNLQKLVERDLIRECAATKTYRLTQIGEVFIDAIKELVDTVERKYGLAAYIDKFPQSLPVDSQCSSTCQVTVPETGQPYAPMFRLNSLLSTATTVSMYIPVFDLTTARMIATQMEETTEIKIIVDEKAVDDLQYDQRSILNSIDTHESGSLHLVTEGPQYGILLLENSVVLATYDENNRVLSLLESSDTELSDWVEARYQEQETHSNPYRPMNAQ